MNINYGVHTQYLPIARFLLRAGKTRSEIAKELRMSYPTICRWLKT
jgi:DNA-binding transcriptional regulator LsrR (DeoR family)